MLIRNAQCEECGGWFLYNADRGRPKKWCGDCYREKEHGRQIGLSGFGGDG